MAKMREYYRYHPEWFFKNWLKTDLYPQQRDICYSIIDNRITTVASCNAAGKTDVAGGVVLWYLMSWDESIVVTTAPKWQQIKDLLWRKVNTKWDKAAETYPLSNNRPNVVSWDIDHNHFAVGVAGKDPSKIQGYHADSGHLLVVIDEAAAVDEPMFEGVWALMTATDCRLLMIGNPTSQTGTFRDSHKSTYPSTKIKIDMFDTPNFIANNIRNEDDLVQAIESKRKLKMPLRGLKSPQSGYEDLKRWGVNHPMYQARDRARFPEVGENNLIPVSSLEKACSNERLEQILGLVLPDGSPQMRNGILVALTEAEQQALDVENEKIRQTKLAEYIESHNMSRGVDVARFGSDATVVQPRWGAIVGQAVEWHKMDTMATAGHVWKFINNVPTDFTGVDVIGVGAGVVDRLHESQEEAEARGEAQWAHIWGVNVAEAPTEVPEGLPTMQFANKRAELYWKLAAMFERGEIYLMPDKDGNPPEELMADLSALQYKYLGSKIYIEEKAEMKKRLQRSPDRGDSLMLSLGVGNGDADWVAGDGLGTAEEDDEAFEPESINPGEPVDLYADDYQGQY